MPIYHCTVYQHPSAEARQKLSEIGPAAEPSGHCLWCGYHIALGFEQHSREKNHAASEEEQAPPVAMRALSSFTSSAHF